MQTLHAHHTHSLHAHRIQAHEVHSHSPILTHLRHGTVVSLLFEVDVATQDLILVSDLREQFLVEADLLYETHDGLLLFVLHGQSSYLHHLLLLFGLYVSF